ncbi:MAG TPA: electron transport complex subunit E [Thermodesulforhabdus norvegica]|uniref:Ion-translocating oxidoreductase complex subunit E n=1 Tax=Thermodesulforhabdus norvegica TaxID=39841 RepID=A0A7C0WSI7_9BACT|nr:electron transport complex subunit E [Deltaproteobacteria bacterium]MBW2069322.1 electron transport complex subunit E [Deltaproteobacteria bacterium]HDL89573.1 electron transport complex subunit E [Thermodesulforhabdus norvegica]
MKGEVSLGKEFTKGLWRENPVLVMLLGLCPTLAVTNSVKNALGMIGAVFFVLTCSSIMVSLIKKLVPPQVRIATYIVIIATFVTMADRFLAAYFPALSKALGPYVPLIVVNCIILGRQEAFASRHGVVASVADAVGMSLGFGIALMLLSSIREILGNGTWLGVPIVKGLFTPWQVMILPAGAFLALGVLVSMVRYFKNR